MRPGDLMVGLNGIDPLESPRLQRMAEMAISLEPEILRKAIEAVDGRTLETASIPRY